MPTLSESAIPGETLPYDRFLDHVVHRGGFRSPADAEGAVRAVLTVLGEALSPGACGWVADEVPPALADLLRVRTHVRGLTDADVYHRVAEREHAQLGFAREHTGVVLEALAAVLSPYARERLAGGLPSGMAVLLEPPAVVPAPTPVVRAREQTTLASGRPGSRHPLSEARPDRAHRESVARADNPHDDTKLSSSHGLTQEREDDSLARGRLGSRRPLTDQ